MATKKINTDLQIEAGLLDGDGNSGTANQILISTGTGVDWVDGSGSSIIGGPYLPLAGGTMTGTNGIIFPDNFNLKIGTGSDLQIYHSGTESKINNDVGNLLITNFANDSDIIFSSDNGSGATTPYFQLDGSHTQSIAWKDIHFVDGIKAKFGDYASPDLQIYHDGSDSYIDDTGTGWLRLRGNGGVILSSYSEGETMLQATRNGAVSLYYDNSKKFETSSTGVSVTGGGIFTGSIYSGSTIGNLTGGSLGQQLELGNSSITTLRFDADAWRVYAGGSGSSGEAFRVTETGNVGIGTTSPARPLHIQTNNSSYGSVRIYRDSTSLGEVSIGFFGKSNQPTNEAWVIGEGGWSNATDFVIGNENGGAGGNVRLLIQRDGNVGIGTTSPDVKLEINGGADAIAKITGTTTAARFDYETNSHHRFWQLIESDGRFRFYDQTNTSERLAIDSSGNVGIGTTSPAVQLELGDNTADEKLRLTGAASGKPLMTFYNTTTKIGQIASSSVGVTVTSLGSGNMSFENGGNNRLVIDNSGNVGIGTTSPNAKLQINNSGSGNIASFSSFATAINNYAGITLHTETNSGNDWYGSEIRSINTAGNPSFLNPRLGFFTQDNDTYLPANRTEKMSILGNGSVGIGTPSPSSKLHVKDTSLSGTLAYFEASSGAQGATNVRVDCLQYGTGIAFFRDGFVGGGACSFRNDSGTQVGSITIGTSSTAYNTSSDYRLKENLTLITDGIDRLKQLKPKRFNFIGETQTVDGFIAHEAKEVVPESVTGEKDEVLLNGDPVYQGIDQAKIVPLLTAALQEAVAKIEDLENRIQTLENK